MPKKTMLPRSEQHNIRQLEDLNQRGGRMLTVVDLIEAGTLSVEMAAAVMDSLAKGASLLTGARPGGAGKTTVLAAFLNLLPPDVNIVTVDDPAIIYRELKQPPDEPVCYLVHEIGAGHWYGYLWGRPVADYFRLAFGPHRIASCLHADTFEELRGILTGPPLGVNPLDLDRVGIVGFIHIERLARGTVARRLAALYLRSPYAVPPCRFVYDSSINGFSRGPWAINDDEVGALELAPGNSPERTFKPSRHDEFCDFIEHLLKIEARSLADVREQVLAFYKSRSR
ncbi:MAG: hypothetical protein ACUVQH_02425 [Thermogutta sp.]